MYLRQTRRTPIKVKHFLVGAALSATVFASVGMTLVRSDFDTGADGWSAANGASDFAWEASGGDVGGFVHAKDWSTATLWFFKAPSVYLGDMGSAYGGSLSYRLKSDSSSAPLETAHADVQLLGQDGTLLAFGGGFKPSSEWATYLVPLTAGDSWHVGSVSGSQATQAEMMSVLSDLKALRISGDYMQAVETTSLDTVVLSAVPEPASVLMLLTGLAMLAGTVSRRR
ncbi:MAG: laminin B domain-containing protein [Burkholderiales bacterium]